MAGPGRVLLHAFYSAVLCWLLLYFFALKQRKRAARRIS
jgi:hypothetical protein